MIIQDSITILTDHLTSYALAVGDDELAIALEFAIKVLKEKLPVDKEPEYTPVCPRGYTDCVWDPAYIKFHDPEWYEELYGGITPEEAAHKENGCYDRVKEDPDMKYYCYDDEDK